MFEENIKQKQLADYLGVSAGYISQVIAGEKTLSDEKLSKVLNNPFGWDTSLLGGGIEEDSESQTKSPIEEKPRLETEVKPQLSDVEALLRDMLAEERARVDTLNEVIWELKEENGKLKALLGDERKGGGAASAGFSSAADAI